MDLLESNLTDEVLSLVTNSEFSRNIKKTLFTHNVILSFVGKLVLPKVTIRANLPHRPTGIDVCVLVKDLKKRDFDVGSTIWRSKWQKDIASSSDSSVPKVEFLPISELKVGYQSFEARRKLAATFDVFLADKRIVHHLPTNLGKVFYKSADKVPVPITVEGKNLVDAVKKGLNTCIILLKESGTTQSVVVGNVEMSRDEIHENVVSVARAVIDKWPGGAQNLRSIYIRGVGPSVPLYYDNSAPNKHAAIENLKQLKHKKNGTEEEELPCTDGNVSAQLITTHIKKSKSKLPISALLEVAKTLPLSESQIAEAFANKPKVPSRKSISKTSSKPLKSKGKPRGKK